MTDSPERAKGRRLLRELLPWARAEARKGEGRMVNASPLGEATSSHITEDNLDGLMIYPAPLGGWHADVVFKRVPAGVPNTIGTPVETPCRTRAEAEEAGKRLLVMLLAVAEQNRAKGVKPSEPVFLLDGWSMPLLPDLYKVALAAMPEFAEGYGSKGRAEQRIRETLDELCPDGFDGDAFNKWDHLRQAKLMSVLHIAALSGLFAYPPRRDRSPSGHSAEASSSTRH